MNFSVFTIWYNHHHHLNSRTFSSLPEKLHAHQLSDITFCKRFAKLWCQGCASMCVFLPLRGGVVSVLVGGSGMIFFLEAALNCKAFFLIRGGWCYKRELGKMLSMRAKSFQSDSVTLWAVARLALQSMGFSRQEYLSGLLCPSPGDLPHPGIKPESLTSPPLAGGFFTSRATWEDALGRPLTATVGVVDGEGEWSPGTPLCFLSPDEPDPV